MVKRLAALAWALLWCAASRADISPTEAALVGTWYNPQTSGQGVLVDVLAGAPKNVVFAGWYTYTNDGQHKLWLVMQGTSSAQSQSQALDLYLAGSGNFNEPPSVSSQKVGTATLTLTSPTSINIDFAFTAPDPRWDQNGSMTLTRIAPAPQATLSAAEWALRGSWYEPAKSGQGLQVDVIGIDGGPNLEFATWYTFGKADHDKFWLTLSGPSAAGSVAQTVGIYLAGDGTFNKPPRVSSQKVGTATLTPTGNDSLRFDFAFDQDDARWDRTGTMTLTRIAPARADSTLAACTSNAQCQFGQVCGAGQCIVPGTLGLGAQCSANRDCASGLTCSGGVCTPAGAKVAGDYCAPADCASNLSCDLYGLGGACVVRGPADVGQACTESGDCVAGLACGVGGTCEGTLDAFPPFAGVSCAPDESTFRVYFQVPRPGAMPPDFFRLPFPNDARILADGTLDLSDFPRPGTSPLGFDLVDRYADALSAEFAGFSSESAVTFRFSRELDFSSTGGDTVHFVDITDPGQPGFGADRGRSWAYDTGRHAYLCQNALVLSPNHYEPLRPGGIYAAYLTTGIRSIIGAAPVQDPDLAVLLGTTAPPDQALARAWTRYANFRAYLQAQNIPANQIAGASVFRVEDPIAKLRALAAAVEAQPLPAISDLTLCNGNTASPCAIAGDGARVCGDSSGAFYELQGHLSVPNFQQGTSPFERPQDGGQIAFDAQGAPVQNGTQDVCFALTIPKTAVPAGGWPLVVHAHDTGGSFRSAVDTGIAASLATAPVPMATLTLEGVAHGARRGQSTRPLDGLVFNIANPRAARDNRLQGAAEVLQALRVSGLAPFAAPGVGMVDFDPARIYFFGAGQGSDAGLPATALTARTPAVVLSGAGSDLSDEILARTSPTDAKAALSYELGEALYANHPFLTLLQAYLDPVDLVNYAPLVLNSPPAGAMSKHVYLPSGLGDTYTPTSVLNTTARTMGVGQAAPVLQQVTGLEQLPRPVSLNRLAGDGPFRTAALFQYAPGPDYDGHFVSTRNPASIADWIAFLSSHAQTGAPVVP